MIALRFPLPTSRDSCSASSRSTTYSTSPNGRLPKTFRSWAAPRRSLLGCIGFLRIVLWQRMHFTNYGPHYLLVAASVLASLIGVVTFGTLTGSMLPFLLRRLRFDPATASAPFVATLVDVTGLCIYF